MTHVAKKFSIGWFAIQTILQLGGFYVCLALLLPRFWAAQIQAGVGAFILTFLSFNLFNALFEWGFHRYVLHGLVVSWLRRFSRGHRHHHALTPIKLERVPHSVDRYVLNRYPITSAEQYPDSAFPPYALAGFAVFFSPLILGVQFLLPHLPIVVAGYAAVTWSMACYEILHAIEHLPYEWWKQATEHPRFGIVWRKLYGFHHYHHANIACNEAISGFIMGFPIWDLLFRTYRQPPELLLEGRMATFKDFRSPPTWPVIDAIDDWAKGRESRFVHAKQEKLIGQLQTLAARIGRIPTWEDIEQASRQRLIATPDTICDFFESLEKALRAAKLLPSSPFPA